MKLSPEEKRWFEDKLGHPWTDDDVPEGFMLGYCEGLEMDGRLDTTGRGLKERANRALMPDLAGLSMETIPDRADEWKEWVKKNTMSAYSAVCVKAVMIIGSCLDKGMSPAEAEKRVDELGLTAFQMSSVVVAVFRFSPMGEIFRRWWNLSVNKEQGMKANEKGSVLNPAVVKLTKTK